MLAPYPDRLRSSRSTSTQSGANAAANSTSPTPPPSHVPPSTSSSQHRLFSSRSTLPLTRMRTNSLSSPSPSQHVDSSPTSGDHITPRSSRNSSRRPAPQRRPSTASGVLDQKHQPSVPVTTPSASPIQPFSDLLPTRRKSTKKSSSARNEGAPTQLSRSSSATPVDLTERDARFSTADRAILEELKLGAAARKSQFKMKGNKKHHAYLKSEAPYPRNYERPVIDHDVWETGFIRQLSGSQTFHVFAAPPTKVLDLGCGSGYWILECAKLWRNCEFVGLDLVPLHPDLSHLRSSDLGSRIKWVQANCLEGLPFENEEFDFVHIKRIAHGIPEDKWDFILEEILRVMKPGAAIEVIEEDLFFPGQSPDPPSPSRSPTPIPYLATPRTSTHHPPNGNHHNLNEQRSLSQFGSAATITDTTTGPLIYPPSHSTIGANSMLTLPTSIHNTDLISSSGNSDILYSDSLRPPGAPLNPRDHSLLEYIYTEMHAARFINLSPLSLLASSLPVYFKNVRSHAPIMFMFPPPDLAGVKGGRGSSGITSKATQHSHIGSGKSTAGTLIGGRQILDHSQQYVILDESAVGPGTVTARHKASSSSLHLPSTATNTGFPTLNSFATSALLSSESFLLSEEHTTSAVPIACSQLAGDDIDSTSWLNTLPNQRLKFDLQSLNLHLSTRVTEILACAEAMWDWICEYQDTRRSHRGQLHMHKEHSLSRNAHLEERGGAHRFSTELTGMSRAEFDVLLTRFELDMRDCINMESRITSAFHAPTPALPLTNDRKAFDNACEKWEEYQKERERHKTLPAGVPLKEGADQSLKLNDGEAAGSTDQRLSRTIRVFCGWKASGCA